MATQVPYAERLTAPPAWALACVPGLEDGRPPLALARLGGGSVNDVFRVDTLDGRFVVRLDGAQWRRPGVERNRELALHTCAAAAGLAPAIVRSAPQSDGLLILEYLDGKTWTAEQCTQSAGLQLLGERLASLHAIAPPPISPFEPVEVARGYLECMTPATPVHAQAQALLTRLHEVCARLTPARRPPSIVHGDLVHDNLLQGHRLWLLDWEYAQLADPLMDVACLLAYYPGARPHTQTLLEAAGFNARQVAAELQLRIYVYEALTWLWHGARGESVPAL